MNRQDWKNRMTRKPTRDLIRGGQGREPEDHWEAACVVLACVALAIIAIAVALFGG